MVSWSVHEVAACNRRRSEPDRNDITDLMAVESSGDHSAPKFVAAGGSPSDGAPPFGLRRDRREPATAVAGGRRTAWLGLVGGHFGEIASAAPRAATAVLGGLSQTSVSEVPEPWVDPTEELVDFVSRNSILKP